MKALWVVVLVGIAAGVFVGTRGEGKKAKPVSPSASVTADDAEKMRRSVLAVMASDLRGPEAPTGARLVAALGLIHGMAQRGEIRKAGTAEDIALVGELRRIQREGHKEAREAASLVLNTLH